MMNYWRGYMNWPLDKNWKCRTCETKGPLIWGLVHGICRCAACHTEYSMRDFSQDDDPIVTAPICRLVDEYKQPVKAGWEIHQLPISEWNDDMWDEAFAQAE